MTWQREAIDVLLGCKREGLPWPAARRRAITVVGKRIPEKDQLASSLFDQGNTQAAFFWRVAEKAYNDVHGAAGSGDGPGIRWFRVGMASEDVDVRTGFASVLAAA